MMKRNPEQQISQHICMLWQGVVTYLYIMASVVSIPHGCFTEYIHWLWGKLLGNLFLKKCFWFQESRTNCLTDLSFSRTLPWRFRRHIAALQNFGFKLKSDQEYKIIQFTFGRVGFELSCIAIAKPLGEVEVHWSVLGSRSAQVYYYTSTSTLVH